MPVLLAGILFMGCTGGPGRDEQKESRWLAEADSLVEKKPEASDSLYLKVVHSKGSTEILRAEAFLGLANLAEDRGTTEPFLQYLVGAWKNLQGQENPDLKARLYYLWGRHSYQTRVLREGQWFFQGAYRQAERSNDSVIMCKSLLGQAMVYLELGNYAAAGKHITAGMSLATRMKAKDLEADFWHQHGVLAGYLDDYQEALVCERKSVTLNHRLGRFKAAADGYINMGIYYKNLDEPDSALQAYQEADRYLEESKDTLRQVMVRYNLGILLKNQGDYLKAEEQMNQILDYCTRNHIMDGRVYAISGLASIYLETGRAAKGLELIESAIRKASELGLINGISRLYQRKKFILIKLGRFEEALATAEKSQEILDTLESIEKKKEILNLKARYDWNIKELENKALINTLAYEKSRYQVNLFAVTLALLGAMILALVIYLRKKRLSLLRQLDLQKQEVLEREKALKEADLQRLTLESDLREKEISQLNLENQLRTETIARLEMHTARKEQELVFQSLVRAELVQTLRTLHEKLQPFYLKINRKKDQNDFSSLLTEVMREGKKDPLMEFETLFKDLHPHFYEQLIQRFPGLSRSELQMCAMLRLGLSTKDIGRLVNLSLSTIETTRYHIRQKLGLESRDNLAVFLMGL